MTATAGEGYVAKADDGYRTRRGPIVEELAHSDGGQPTIQNEKRVLLDVHGAITFRWPTLRRNDCTMTEAEFTIFPDGRAVWWSYVTTSDADDVWLIRALAFIDVHGVELWRMPQFNGPNMVIDNYDYIFHNPNLAYPAYIFPHVRTINMTYHC